MARRCSARNIETNPKKICIIPLVIFLLSIKNFAIKSNTIIRINATPDIINPNKRFKNIFTIIFIIKYLNDYILILALIEHYLIV